ncbi:glycoside hydrolase family 15 protein [Demequina capsici]|uniref:Glycoside hydrolase family 15 protein n=1 Tax=Demequina capsici TaxID=3075620 RepID=A0AA96JGQ4_9MICO|nr:glycoside hydrolase family 15 protein [Demequina sp. PMTSA13]WNM28199.1 glycoside hydrolase family 15 protein [Demequina sp. PMTSA13]
MVHAAERDIPTSPLRDHAFGADGERGMVIGPDGAIVWMCAPRWDSDAVFSRLLGGRGAFTVRPRSAPRVWGGRYEPRSLVWRHRWSTTDGPFECSDALAYPGDDDTAIVLRRLESTGASPHLVDVSLAPRAGFGVDDATGATCVDGVWTWRTGHLHVRVTGLPSAVMSADGELTALLEVPAGGRVDVVLELSTSPRSGPVDADALWAATRARWHEVVPQVTGTAADADVERFYAVAHGLTSRHGGMVAAATTGLPEQLAGSRNYDYRYAWVRDQCFAGLADSAAGGHRLLDSAVAFIAARLRTDGASLRPAYTVTGEPVPDERPLPVPGYPGATPIAGNHANAQFQLDAFGEVLLLFARAARAGRLDDAGWEAARIAADAIAARWDEPDAGIWELEDRWWTHSRLICVSGLRAIADEAPPEPAREWRALARSIEARVDDECVTPDGRWGRAADDARLDVALLLPAIRGGVDARAEVNARTLDAVLADLVHDGHAYRFRHGEIPLGEAEGAFLLCEATLALALVRLGRREEAVRWFERVRGCVTVAGLYSEEWDPEERQLRGNIPQAFVHALVAQAAVELGR